MNNRFNILHAVALLLICWGCGDQSGKLYDEAAIEQLDKLTETIGKLSSCSFTLKTINGHINDGELADHTTATNDIYLRGPDKMYIYIHDAPVRKAFYYNGKKLAVLRFDDKTYDEIDAPDNIIKTIDEVHNAYGIDFPAADFLYPTLTDDLMMDFDTIAMMDDTNVGDILCKQIYASNSDYLVYMAIDGSRNLPVQLEVFGRGAKEGQIYNGVYSDWRLDTELPDGMFDFSPPEGTSEAELLTKSIK